LRITTYIVSNPAFLPVTTEYSDETGPFPHDSERLRNSR
jgi:hypothetical protein